MAAEWVFGVFCGVVIACLTAEDEENGESKLKDDNGICDGAAVSSGVCDGDGDGNGEGEGEGDGRDLKLNRLD